MRKNLLKLTLQLWIIAFISGSLKVAGQGVTTQTFNYTGSIQTFTIPACVSQITIDARGAQGGGGIGGNGGLGARMMGTHTVTTGQVLSIVVGQQGLQQVGGNTQNSSGGGGGSFVFIAGGSPTLFVAAGGGGGRCNYAGSPALHTGANGTVVANGNASNDGYAGGIAGLGGAQSSYGGGGCGWLGNGNGPSGSGGQGYNTWTGGLGLCCFGGGGNGGAGGYGGGGGGGNAYGGGGGGGGYSGGGAGGDPNHGGGGGSFSNGLSQSNTSGFQTGNGVVYISYPAGAGSPVVTISPASPSLCSGSSLTLTASGASSYTWNPGGANGSSVSISPSVTTVYTVIGSAPSCSATGSTTANVTVNSSPVLTITPSNSLLCGGGSVSISGSGATNYTWNPGALTGASISVSPSVSTVYTVVGTNSVACSATSTIMINSGPNPSVIASSSPAVICSGVSTSLAASGANTYTWNPGGLTGAVVAVSPTATTIYTAIGSTSIGCTGTSTTNVIVNAAPSMTVSSNTATLCAGSSATISASGANSYSWSTGPTTSVIVVSPTVSTTYTVTGVGGNSCTATATVFQFVSACTTVKSNGSQEINSIAVYPNPGSGIFNLRLNKNMEVMIFNALGKLCFREKLYEGENAINLGNLPSGLYLVKISDGNSGPAVKLVIE